MRPALGPSFRWAQTLRRVAEGFGLVARYECDSGKIGRWVCQTLELASESGILRRPFLRSERVGADASYPQELCPIGQGFEGTGVSSAQTAGRCNVAGFLRFESEGPAS